jgi:hypothetical protein
MKIRPVGAELFHAEGWTDGHDEANSRFSQFCERALKTVQHRHTKPQFEERRNPAAVVMTNVIITNNGQATHYQIKTKSYK